MFQTLYSSGTVGTIYIMFSWCSVFHTLTAQEQLELLSLSDKFLLPELNMRISHQIIRGVTVE